MLKKELPLKHIKINYDPIIDTPLEIIAQYPDLYEQKIAENGIDTIIYDNDISDNVSFYNITYALNKDCMMFMNLPLEVARFSISNMTDYIIQLLEKSYYVQFLCDPYWVSNYVSYQKEHDEHPMLIYGFDTVNKYFLAQDYFDYKQKTKQLVSFKDIDASYYYSSFSQRPDEYQLLNACVLHCSKIGNTKAKEINCDLIKQSLINFLNCYPYTKVETEGIYYGIQFFDILINRYHNDSDYVSLKHCHFILSHIQLMLQRVKILQKNKIASQEEWESILLPLTELTKKVSRLELRILKIRLSGCRFNIPYDLELLDIKSQYARIIENIIRILS